MKSRLICTILALATISLQTPKKITKEWSKWGVRGLSFVFLQFWSKMSKRGRVRGGMGYLYPLSQKLAVGRAVPGNSGYMSGYSGQGSFADR
jgi:hypothetical protein